MERERAARVVRVPARENLAGDGYRSRPHPRARAPGAQHHRAGTRGRCGPTTATILKRLAWKRQRLIGGVMTTFGKNPMSAWAFGRRTTSVRCQYGVTKPK